MSFVQPCQEVQHVLPVYFTLHSIYCGHVVVDATTNSLFAPAAESTQIDRCICDD
jgi:hypothetical protein